MLGGMGVDGTNSPDMKPSSFRDYDPDNAMTMGGRPSSFSRSRTIIRDERRVRSKTFSSVPKKDLAERARQAAALFQTGPAV